MRTLRFLLTGVGNVGRPFLEMIHARAALLRERYRLELRLVGVADSGGAAVDAARAKGGQVLLLARAEPRDAGRWDLSVRPTVVGGEHPLGRLGAREMGLVYRSDIHGTLTLTSGEQGAWGASAAMLRDVLDITRSGPAAS